ncbi:RNA-directed DNA polymerase [Accumulibacter sp.]|uniref:Reverse transcriptase family protein n=1 Tax=Accumulibacter regalis TaxID=522306 RepID=C7RUW7_ACCRE|nr:RNA-directed DNA polymerase [Accumulibacter sp.]MBN8497886.1 RNA-directed DNA polymerase [Accumulibacter sp.]MBO3716327.1 RNA-directed DNA polymerase [Accumulibacter sp.]
MKRLAIRLEEVAERSNLMLATWKAARGKRQRPAVARFLADLDGQLDHLAACILNGQAPQGQYTSFTIHDPKRRLIHAACFADRVLQHAILNLAEPRFEAMLVDSTYACRPGKGVHAAARQVQRNLQRFAWRVQVDVDSYFPSIDHACLKALLATRFKGAGFLALLGRIIDTAGDAGRGLPIGSLTSQHFANAYLDTADRRLLEDRRVRAHVRYMDDILWWCDSRADALATLAELNDFLRRERGLQLKPKVSIAPSRTVVAWCGFRIDQAVILPSRRKLARYRRHARQIECAWASGQVSEAEVQRASANSLATLAHSRSLGFRRRFWQQHPSLDDLAAGQPDHP